MKEETAQNNIPQKRYFQFIKPNLVKLIFGLALMLGFFTFSYIFLNKKPEEPFNDPIRIGKFAGSDFEMKNFRSVEEFKEYLSKQPTSGHYSGMMRTNEALMVETAIDAAVVPTAAKGALEIDIEFIAVVFPVSRFQ